MNFETIYKTKLRIRIMSWGKYLRCTSEELKETTGHATEKQLRSTTPLVSQNKTKQNKRNKDQTRMEAVYWTVSYKIFTQILGEVETNLFFCVCN